MEFLTLFLECLEFFSTVNVVAEIDLSFLDACNMMSNFTAKGTLIPFEVLGFSYEFMLLVYSHSFVFGSSCLQFSEISLDLLKCPSILKAFTCFWLFV